MEQNKYRKKLREIANTLLSKGEYDMGREILNLIKDNDLLLVNKNCLPLQYQIAEQTRMLGCGIRQTKFKVGLELYSIKVFDDTPLPKEAQKEIAAMLEQNLYRYLEEHEECDPNLKEFQYVDWNR